MNANYYIPANTPISNYVAGIWESCATGISRELILPQGVVEMVFNLAGPVQGILPFKDTATQAPACFLQGWNSHVVDVQYSSMQHLFGIRLQPYMVKELLGIYPSACKDILLDLTLLHPKFKSLTEQLYAAKGFAERVGIIEKGFPLLTKTVCPRT